MPSFKSCLVSLALAALAFAPVNAATSTDAGECPSSPRRTTLFFGEMDAFRRVPFCFLRVQQLMGTTPYACRSRRPRREGCPRRQAVVGSRSPQRCRQGLEEARRSPDLGPATGSSGRRSRQRRSRFVVGSRRLHPGLGFPLDPAGSRRRPDPLRKQCVPSYLHAGLCLVVSTDTGRSLRAREQQSSSATRGLRLPRRTGSTFARAVVARTAARLASLRAVPTARSAFRLRPSAAPRLAPRSRTVTRFATAPARPARTAARRASPRSPRVTRSSASTPRPTLPTAALRATPAPRRVSLPLRSRC